MSLSQARKDFLQGGSGLAPGFGSPDLLTLLKERLVVAPTLTITPEVGDDVVVTVQLKNLAGENVAEKRLLTWWVSDTAGGVLAATAPSGGVAVSGGIAVQVLTTNKSGIAMTDATGEVIFTLTEAGTDTFYLNVSLDGMGGQFVSSGDLDFAA